MKSGKPQVDDDFPACLPIAPACLRDKLTWINDRIWNGLHAANRGRPLIDFRPLTKL